MKKDMIITREKAFKLIKLIQDIVNTRDLSMYLGDYLTKEKVEFEVNLSGVSNGFLSEVIRTITGYEVEVYGEVEELFYYRGLKEWSSEKGFLIDTCLTAQDRFKKYLDYFRVTYDD